MDVTLHGFSQFFFEDDTKSFTPDKKKNDDRDDYLDAIDDELGTDWKSAVKHDKLVIQQPMELGNYVYKTSTWNVLSANDNQVLIQLDANSPDLSKNVFRKKSDGKLERLPPQGPFDTEPKLIPKNKFTQMLDAALRSLQQQGMGGMQPMGMPPSLGT